MRRTIRSILRHIGWDVEKYSVARLVLMRQAHDIDLVLDVGANVGQFGRSLRAAGFKGRIVSFEPVSIAHRRLVAAARGDSAWTVAPRQALGARGSRVEINVSGNLQSSSLLPMLPRHSEAAPESVYASREHVDVVRLDDVFPTYADPAARAYLKLDVQGFESEVLRGATNTLPGLVGLQLELALSPLYEGEGEALDLLHAVRRAGFDIWDLVPGLRTRPTFRLLQMDAVFFRPCGN